MSWYLLALISALFSASAAIVEKKALIKDKALNFSFILAFFNLVLSIPFFWASDNVSLFEPRMYILFAKTFLGALSFLFIMKGLKNMQISGALPLLVLTPGLVAIAGYVIPGHTVSGAEWIGMGLLLAGTYALQLGQGKGILDPFKLFIKTKGRIYILIALGIFTLTSILDKILLSGYKLNPVTFFAWQHLFLFIHFSIFVIVLYFKNGKHSLAHSVKISWKWILLVSIFTIIYRYTQIEAVKAGNVAMVLSLKRTSVFFAAVIGGTLFKDTNLLRKSIATVIMLAGAAVILIY
ncbi:MAG: DMT family transporter [Bacteroidales bacterium]|jgi:uncharacterized membrane protein|nr:DMT family transporter [Bacteroidales bacterium]